MKKKDCVRESLHSFSNLGRGSLPNTYHSLQSIQILEAFAAPGTWDRGVVHLNRYLRCHYFCVYFFVLCLTARIKIGKMKVLLPSNPEMVTGRDANASKLWYVPYSFRDYSLLESVSSSFAIARPSQKAVDNLGITRSKPNLQ